MKAPEKIACYSCERKLELPAEIVPLTKVECPNCSTKITIPGLLGDLVVDSLVDENDMLKSYKGFKQGEDGKLSLAIVRDGVSKKQLEKLTEKVKELAPKSECLKLEDKDIFISSEDLNLEKLLGDVETKPQPVEKPKKTTTKLQTKPSTPKAKTKAPKSKNILKRQRRKGAAGMISALLLTGLVVGGFLWLKSSFKPVEKPVVAEKSKPKPKKNKAKKIKVVQGVPKEVVRELPKFVEKPKMTGSISQASFAQILDQKCMSCHGAEGKEVEGKFDLKKLLASKGVNAKYWQAMYQQVESGDMLPEDEEALSDDEKMILLTELRRISAKTEVARITRALTPDEIKNTLVDLFKIDDEIYNPFTPLYNNYAQNDFYTNQKSVITPYYLDDLYEALHDALESYVALKPQTEPMNVSGIFPSSTYMQLKFKNESQLRWCSNEDRYAQINFQKHDIVDDKETRKKKQLDEIGPESEIRKTLDKLTLPPGTYKISFDAQSVNMHSKVNEKRYGPKVAALYNKIIEKYSDYGFPLEFYQVPPGQADPHARVKHMKTITIGTYDMERYTVTLTLNRRNGIGHRFPIGTLPKNRQVSNLVADYIYKGKATLEQKQKVFQDMNKQNYGLPMVKFRNITVEGPFDVDVSKYSINAKERISDINVRKRFRALHEDNLIKMNMPYDYIFSKFKQRQIGPEESYRNSLVAFFLSPDFLTLEYDTKDRRKHARMLSYVFHKSPPSAELNEKFEQVFKKRSTVEFTDWLVDSPKFACYVDSFARQWLHTMTIKNHMPEKRLFREFHDKNLMTAFPEEMKHFILHLFKENRPVKELVTANYSFLNNDLISFYEHGPKWEEDGFKNYEIRSKDRGGILASGAYATVNGNGIDPLPIKRAEWILTNLLDSRLPPPPEEINLDSFQQALDVPLHEKLKAHSDNPQCFSCHKKMDPIAVMMNGFNAIGGTNHKNTFSMVKFDDTSIRNFTEMKEYLGSQDEKIARGFVKSLLRYSLGRDLYVQDSIKIERIIEENKENGFMTRNLLSSAIRYFFF
ncbi:MAG: DUF1588 domain-containing protein [Lentisphaerales bacterium]|nr:DUF1588 domain-containing protein [Lentisphaerales bacterium]